MHVPPLFSFIFELIMKITQTKPSIQVYVK
nr:MAG TPA: hypothetical protein [Caudoviricetes sp.]